MGRPADPKGVTDESLTVRDNRTGKTYTIPYVTLGIFLQGNEGRGCGDGQQ